MFYEHKTVVCHQRCPITIMEWLPGVDKAGPKLKKLLKSAIGMQLTAKVTASLDTVLASFTTPLPAAKWPFLEAKNLQADTSDKSKTKPTANRIVTKPVVKKLVAAKKTVKKTTAKKIVKKPEQKGAAKIKATKPVLKKLVSAKKAVKKKTVKKQPAK